MLEERTKLKSKMVSIKEMHKKLVYLGNNVILSINKSKDFKSLKDQISSRLEGWNQHLLSKVWKITFINFVVQAIPTYTMATFCIPASLCNEVEKLVKRFW